MAMTGETNDDPRTAKFLPFTSLHTDTTGHTLMLMLMLGDGAAQAGRQPAWSSWTTLLDGTCTAALSTTPAGIGRMSRGHSDVFKHTSLLSIDGLP